jgi:Ni,Fe-hydrogenase III small subunit
LGEFHELPYSISGEGFLLVGGADHSTPKTVEVPGSLVTPDDAVEGFLVIIRFILRVSVEQFWIPPTAS